mmetsp:Transcript_13706/g.19006  ORF Transcript_13706/g.19006 Transcript_13706/m.19006 type:complete len:81 (-) Transcript_13706:398-640(-)
MSVRRQMVQEFVMEPLAIGTFSDYPSHLKSINCIVVDNVSLRTHLGLLVEVQVVGVIFIGFDVLDGIGKVKATRTGNGGN